MKNKTPAPAMPSPVEIAPAQMNLGLAILVRFACPTNSKGARWIASIDDGRHKVRVSVHLLYTCDLIEKENAAALALGRWLLTFPEDSRPVGAFIHSRGHDSRGSLYFFTLRHS